MGPSFLGLSDPPVLEPDSAAAQDEAAEPRSHGKLWLVAAVVALFAVLGGLEWRAQVHQTGNGPIEIIKAKLHRSATPESRAPPEAASNDTNAKPEMQVEEQPKPAGSDQPSAGLASSPATSSSAAAVNTPAATASATNQKTADQGATPNNTANPGATQSAATPAAAAKTPTAAPSTSTSSNPTSAPKPTASNPTAGVQPKPAEKAPVPGDDEMTKARNASDSAAAAAWLWKATAKGNPDAPVQLADMYVKGDGVPRSCEQALVLLKTAAEKENTRARNRLAAMYENGSCVQRNRVEAYRWVSSALAADPNSQWAQENKNLIWQQMTPEERTMAQRYR